jgi:hypothetical protein
MSIFGYINCQELQECGRRCGPMDKAPAYGAGDSRFESVQWYLFDTEEVACRICTFFVF